MDLASSSLSASARRQVERAIVAARTRWETLPESDKDRAIHRALEAARREFWMGFLGEAARKIALAHRHMDSVTRGAGRLPRLLRQRHPRRLT